MREISIDELFPNLKVDDVQDFIDTFKEAIAVNNANAKYLTGQIEKIEKCYHKVLEENENLKSENKALQDIIGEYNDGTRI